MPAPSAGHTDRSRGPRDDSTRHAPFDDAILVVLALAGGACGGDDDGGSGGQNGSDSGLAIAAQDFQFSPASLTVPSGESTITVTNEGETEHSFTLDDESVSEDVEPGDSISVTVDVTEDTGFFCEYHPDQMTGTLSVR